MKSNIEALVEHRPEMQEYLDRVRVAYHDVVLCEHQLFTLTVNKYQEARYAKSGNFVGLAIFLQETPPGPGPCLQCPSPCAG